MRKLYESMTTDETELHKILFLNFIFFSNE